MSDNSAADFMRDELAALLASPALARVAERHSAVGNESPSEQSLHDRDTLPSFNAEEDDAEEAREPSRTGAK